MRYMKIRENDGRDDWEVLAYPDAVSSDKAAHAWSRATYYAQETGKPRPGGFTFQVLEARNLLDALIESARP